MVANGSKKPGKPTAGGNNGGTSSRASELRWFNPYLSEGDRKFLDAKRNELPHLLVAFLEAIEEGWNFSTKFDDRSGRYLATLVLGSNSAGEGRKLAISVRGATASHASILLAYFCAEKHAWEFILEDDPSSDDPWG